MIINYILILLISIIINYIIFKSIFTINILYTFTWVIGAILNLLNYAGLYTASGKIHSYIIVSIIIFNIIYWAFSKKRKQRFNLSEFDFSISIKYLTIVNVCCQIFMIPFLIKAIKIIRTSSFSNLRNYAYVGSDALANSLESRIISWVVSPIFFCSIIIVITLILLKKSSSWLNAMIVIDMFLYTITLGGKMLIVLSILLFVFGYIILRLATNNKNEIKIKKGYYFLLAFVAIYLFYVTQLRALKGLNVFQNFVVYLYGGISYFNSILSSNKFLTLNAVQLHGSATYGFIMTPILYVSHHIFRTPNINAEYITKLVTSKFAYVSHDYTFNSFPTALYYFWRDFHGIPGIIFGTASLCLIYIFIENKFYKYKNIRWFAYYLYFTYIIFSSTQVYGLYDMKSFLNILGILLLTSVKLWEKVCILLHIPSGDSYNEDNSFLKNTLSSFRKIFHKS